jgi:hypothetical protein
MPLSTDTSFEFERSTDINNITKVKDTFKVLSNNIAVPFLAIPLDLTKMKEKFWDKFNDSEFSSSDEFQTYFKGIILKAKGDDGALVPFNLSSTEASVDFLYSKIILVDNVVDTIIKADYSFPLSGIKNSIYDNEGAIPEPTNSFVVQGTAGISAKINILGVNLLNLDQEDPFLAYANKDDDNDNYLSLQELASIGTENDDEFGLLVNDADLTFMINNAFSSDANILPQRLYVYQNKDNGSGGVTPTHLSDSYEEAASYSGVLAVDVAVPLSYTFKITDYISDLLDTSSDDFSPLVLKVFNTTDNAVISGALNQNVLQYNWNPRSVVLFDESGTNDGDNRAKLKIFYSKKKN